MRAFFISNTMTTRLTTAIREAFVNAVMQDVPAIDYYSQIRSAVMKAAIARLPKNVQAIYKDPSSKVFLSCGIAYVGGVGISHLPGFGQFGNMVCLTNTPADKVAEQNAFFAQFNELVAKKAAQDVQRDALRAKLMATAKACNTTKTLLEMLPEFGKYLPTEEAKSTNLPAVTNLVVDLVKAGWPKNGRDSLKTA